MNEPVEKGQQQNGGVQRYVLHPWPYIDNVRLCRLEPASRAGARKLAGG